MVRTLSTNLLWSVLLFFPLLCILLLYFYLVIALYSFTFPFSFPPQFNLISEYSNRLITLDYRASEYFIMKIVF